MPYIGQSLTEGTRREYTYVATASQTTFNAIYTVGAVDVYQNGVLLAPSDYTATTGTTVVFNTGAALNDEITIHCHNTFSVADTVSASQGGTFNQPLTVNSDAATVLTVDRATSDGTLVDFKKNGTSVGSVGSHSGFITMGQGDTSLIFDSNANSIEPFNQNDRTSEDAAITLGWSSNRFKDLYLSGGVYLGGTGAANLLDDYEEGSFTPTVSSSGWAGVYNVTNNGRYTKIGNIVYFSYNLDLTSTSTQPTGAVVLGGLPFASASVSSQAGATRFEISTYNVDYDSTAGHRYQGFIPTTSVTIIQVLDSKDNAAWSVVNHGSGASQLNLPSGRGLIIINGFYFTD